MEQPGLIMPAMRTPATCSDALSPVIGQLCLCIQQLVIPYEHCASQQQAL